MSSLTHPSQYALRETSALRNRRDLLLREANKHRYRLHRLSDLQDQIRQVTTELLKRELEGERKPEPLGDAGAVGQPLQTRLPYKD